MWKSESVTLAIVLLAVAVLFNHPGRPVTHADEAGIGAPVVWEYKVVRAFEEQLNQLGAEGWEVVAAYGDVKGQSAGMRAITTAERAILKRRKAKP